MTTAAELLERLNVYAGDNIWSDVIYPSGAVNLAATEDIDGSGASDRFVTLAGLIVRRDAQTGQWHEAGEYDGDASDDASSHNN